MQRLITAVMLVSFLFLPPVASCGCGGFVGHSCARGYVKNLFGEPLSGVRIDVYIGPEHYVIYTADNGYFEVNFETRLFLIMTKDGYYPYYFYVRYFSGELNLDVCLLSNLSGLVDSLEELQGAVENMRLMIMTLENALYENVALIMNAINEISQEISVLEDRVSYLESDIVNIWDNINSMLDVLKEHENEIENLGVRIDEIESEIENLKQTDNMILGRIDEIESEIQELNQQISLLWYEVGRLWERIRECEKKLEIPSGIPQYSVTVYVGRNTGEFIVPEDGRYVWLLSYNIVPCAGYTSSGIIKFDNVIGDEIVVRYSGIYNEIRYKHILNKNLFVSIYDDDILRKTYVMSMIYGSIYKNGELYENEIILEIDNMTFHVCRTYAVYLPVGKYVLYAYDNDKRYTFSKEVDLTCEFERVDICLERQLGFFERFENFVTKNKVPIICSVVVLFMLLFLAALFGKMFGRKSWR